MTTRRDFLKITSGMLVYTTLPVTSSAQVLPSAAPPRAPLRELIDAWLHIKSDGTVAAFCGKLDFGTGTRAAFTQIIAEELDVLLERVHLTMGQTLTCPNQGLTTDATSIAQGGEQLRLISAEARLLLLQLAAKKWGARIEHLYTKGNGTVAIQGNPRIPISYAQLIGNQFFKQRASGNPPLKSPKQYEIVSKSIPRSDIALKVFGQYSFVHDKKIPNMLHGQVIRPPVLGAEIIAVDETALKTLTGFVKVIRKNNFVGVVADQEQIADRAAQIIKVNWKLPDTASAEQTITELMLATPATTRILVKKGEIESIFEEDGHGGCTTMNNGNPGAPCPSPSPLTPPTLSSSPQGGPGSFPLPRGEGLRVREGEGYKKGEQTLNARFSTPFQMHANIGPSCAIADVKENSATIWSGTQGPFVLRDAIAILLTMPPEQVQLAWMEPAGGFGHNGNDDAAADAALLSRLAGRPVRVQWTRLDEHRWAPKSPAMLMGIKARLDDKGMIIAWDYGVNTFTHSSRIRRGIGNLLAGQSLGENPDLIFFGGDRNAIPPYLIPNQRVGLRALIKSPLRSSALHGLGSFANTFANESFMDELAIAAKLDPIEFRLRHLKDERAIAVLQSVKKISNWNNSKQAKKETGKETGRGVAYVQYKNDSTYVACVVDVEVNRKTGFIRVMRVFVAHDCGLIVNPDGVKNQIEGNVIQAISRSLKEEVKIKNGVVENHDWETYPLLTFSESPDEIKIELISNPENPSLGASTATVCVVPAAIANAIFNAVGIRLRILPFTPARLQEQAIKSS